MRLVLLVMTAAPMLGFGPRPAIAAPKPPLCTAGRFAVQGTPLLGPGGEVVVLANRTIAIGTLCAARPAKLRTTKKGTKVKVTFRKGGCSGVQGKGKVKLSALITQGCSVMDGRLKAPKTPAVSFHAAEDGLSHQAKMPDVPKPDALPNESEIRAKVMPLMPEPVRRYYERPRPIELRPVEFDRYLGKPTEGGRFHVWIRTTGVLPDTPAIHQCVLAYASDMTLLDSALIPHGRTVFDKSIMAASLDHALWFHRPCRADEWLLYAQDSPSLAGARGFSRGLIFKSDGTLVASVAQEGLLRERVTRNP